MDGILYFFINTKLSLLSFHRYIDLEFFQSFHYLFRFLMSDDPLIVEVGREYSIHIEDILYSIYQISNNNFPPSHIRVIYSKEFSSYWFPNCHWVFLLIQNFLILYFFMNPKKCLMVLYPGVKSMVYFYEFDGSIILIKSGNSKSNPRVIIFNVFNIFLSTMKDHIHGTLKL